MRFLRLATALGLALLVASCGARSRDAGAGAPKAAVESMQLPDGPPVDPSIWENPLGKGGTEVASVSDADLGYTPNTPESASGLKSIVATRDAPVSERQIAWTYDSSALDSQYIVVESIVDASAEQSDLETTGKAEPGCTPISAEPNDEGIGDGVRCYSKGLSLVTIQGGTVALLIEGPEVTSVTWVDSLSSSDKDSLKGIQDPGLEIMVAGPAKSLDPSEAVSVAESI